MWSDYSGHVRKPLPQYGHKMTTLIPFTDKQPLKSSNANDNENVELRASRKDVRESFNLEIWLYFKYIDVFVIFNQTHGMEIKIQNKKIAEKKIYM